MNQLNLLHYVPEPVINPLSPTIQPSQAELWQQAKADFYLRLMQRFMNGRRCCLEVRRHEITRLYQLREQALIDLEAVQRKQIDVKKPKGFGQ